jgi:hypothetical protein
MATALKGVVLKASHRGQTEKGFDRIRAYVAASNGELVRASMVLGNANTYSDDKTFEEYIHELLGAKSTKEVADKLEGHIVIIEERTVSLPSREEGDDKLVPVTFWRVEEVFNEKIEIDATA